MRVKWLSPAKIFEESTTHLKAAKLSVQKWYTYGYCSKNALLKKWHISCGLCAYSNLVKSSCNSCILARHSDEFIENDDCVILWREADILMIIFKDRPTKTNFIKFQKKARKLWRVLKKCVEILEKENEG